VQGGVASEVKEGASVYCGVRHLSVVELVAPRRAAQRPSGAAHSVRSTRTGLSQRDKHHLQETDAPDRPIHLLPGRQSN